MDKVWKGTCMRRRQGAREGECKEKVWGCGCMRCRHGGGEEKCKEKVWAVECIRRRPKGGLGKAMEQLVIENASGLGQTMGRLLGRMKVA